MGDRYLTIPAVAEQLAVNPKTVRAWISSGQLRAVNCSRSARSRKPRWRVRLQDLEAFLGARGNNRPTPPRRRRRKADAVPSYI